jgi:hypothetical protein
MARAAAAAGAAALLAACGTRVAHGTAEMQAAASHQGPPPIPAATLRLVATQEMAAIRPLAPGGRPGIGDRARRETAAVSVALARHRSGSKAIGVTLARVQARVAGLGTPRVVWLVSIDPYGGAYPIGKTACSGTMIWPANYVIDVVSVTGQWLTEWTGHVRGVPELPVLGKKLLPRAGSYCPPAQPGS